MRPCDAGVRNRRYRAKVSKPGAVLHLFGSIRGTPPAPVTVTSAHLRPARPPAEKICRIGPRPKAEVLMSRPEDVHCLCNRCLSRKLSSNRSQLGLRREVLPHSQFYFCHHRREPRALEYCFSLGARSFASVCT